MIDKLKEQGWYLTEEGFHKLTTSNNFQLGDVNKIIALALDWDLKDIGAGALPCNPDSNSSISGRIVLQIQKIRNISAPKANEDCTAAPRFLQLELSDGPNSIAALEFERIPSLNSNIPPGTKIFLKAEKVKLLNGYLVLTSDVQILGGKVEVMVEKWEAAKLMSKYAKSNRRPPGSSEPPQWIPFNKRLNASKETLPTDRSFKSLQAANDKDKNSKENDEFNAYRTQAIAEAVKSGKKKVFGGGQQNILDHNVKKILEKGYSEEDAKYALKTTNNNLERALYSLKKKYNKTVTGDNSTKCVVATAPGRLRDRSGITLAKEEAEAAKPQTNVSLFDFLTDKLPTAVTSSNTVQINANNGRNTSKTYNTKPITSGSDRFENNMSSSFAANRSTNTLRNEENHSIKSRFSTFKQRQEERKQQFNNKSIRAGEANNTQNKAQSQNINYTKSLNQSSNGQEGNVNTTGNKNSVKRTENPFKKERKSTPKQSSSDFLVNKLSNDFNNKDLRNNNNYQQKQTQKSNNFDKDLDSLVNNTSKMCIQNKKDLTLTRQQNKPKMHEQTLSSNNSVQTVKKRHQKSASENYCNNSQQHPIEIKETQNFSSKSFHQNRKKSNLNQQDNGFAYDPSKIMGFQSKEANEYAMNLLKNQGLIMQQIQQQTASSQPTSLPPPSQQHQTQVINNQLTDAVAYIPQNPNMFVAPHPVAPHYGVIPAANWLWKEGDLCLAKYWDDGNYYDAKITAIADATCVVFFLGYGNYEEVLKSDCLPISDSQHISVNAYQTNLTTADIAQPTPQAFQQRSTNIHTRTGTGGSQRYRSERQIYIPPPKKNNN